MKKPICIIALLTLFILTDYTANAQSRPRSRQVKSQNKRISRYRGGGTGGVGNKGYTFIGVSINAMNYFGDLAPKESITSTDISFTRPGFGIVANRKVGTRFYLRGSLLYGRLKGSDFNSADPNDENARYRYVRNLHFRNDIIELSAQGVMDITPTYGTFLVRPTFVPYIFAGIAVFYHNPKALAPATDVNTGQNLAEAGQWVALEPLGTEGQYSSGNTVSPYKKIQLAIPIGLGVRYKLNQAFDLSFEIGYRHLFFDHIDDVGRSYVDLSSLNSDLARALSDRSRELTDAETGAARELTNPNVATIYNIKDPQGLVAGYGSGPAGNIRGNINDNDIYIITSIQVTYIMGSSLFGKAKYR